MSQDQTHAVQDRYGAAAKAVEVELCCPVDYDPQYLKVIPQEVLDRDYGCGDPSQYVKPGETVLDLGSGGGKICFIASQVVGSVGKVIGVDRNREMLELARESRAEVTQKTGLDNVDFRCGSIQDLALNLEKLEEFMNHHPIKSREDLFQLEEEKDRLRKEEPLVQDNSIDVVVSNCVLNLVNESDRRAMFKELFRVVKVGGRVAISDIVCDEDVPEHQKKDPELWSGCISGAFREDFFLEAFAEAGFHGVEMVKRDEIPWKVVEGIEYRSVTVVAHKGKQGPCKEGHHAVIYPGPWSEVRDDDGHTFKRGERVAVCEKTFRLLTSSPYSDQIVPLPPYKEVNASDMEDFECTGYQLRAPHVTKAGGQPKISSTEGCDPKSGCC
jgi:arsenite methyltransferase